MSNALERILSRLEQNDEAISTKTASVESVEPSAEEKMLSTVRSLTEATTKTANTANEPSAPVASLEKLASDAQAAESQILTQKAASLGAALADGFMERFAQYDTALGDVAVKTASTVDTAALTKEAYAAARADLEKQAAADYQQGYNDQLVEIQKVAAHCHLSGRASAANVLSILSDK